MDAGKKESGGLRKRFIPIREAEGEASLSPSRSHDHHLIIPRESFYVLVYLIVCVVKSTRRCQSTREDPSTRK